MGFDEPDQAEYEQVSEQLFQYLNEAIAVAANETHYRPGQMDDAHKRRLKKLGKEMIERRSRDLQTRLTEGNPAPVDSDAWARNYKAQTLRQRELRRSPPDRIAASDASRDFVLNEVDPGPSFSGVSTWYVECPRCHDLLHTVPIESVACSCGAIQLDIATRRFLVAPETQPRFVKLIARSE